MLKICSRKPSFSLKKAKFLKSYTVKRRFNHVECSDDELYRYFQDGASARVAMMELGERSWEYQYEFAAEMSKRCHQVMRKNPSMIEAYEVFEEWYLIFNAIN
jgi:hypothetical protein